VFQRAGCAGSRASPESCRAGLGSCRASPESSRGRPRELPSRPRELPSLAAGAAGGNKWPKLIPSAILLHRLIPHRTAWSAMASPTKSCRINLFIAPELVPLRSRSRPSLLDVVMRGCLPANGLQRPSGGGEREGGEGGGFRARAQRLAPWLRGRPAA
jgi:hypothetical protein